MTSPGAVASKVSLKERIAALQQHNAGTMPTGASSVPSSRAVSPGPGAAAPSTTGVGPAAGTGTLRDRISKFEQKGGTPVPRASFGSGVAMPDDGGGRRRGELYGNRVPGLSRTQYTPGARSVSSGAVPSRRGFDGDSDGGSEPDSRAGSPAFLSPQVTGMSAAGSPLASPPMMRYSGNPLIVVSPDPSNPPAELEHTSPLVSPPIPPTTAQSVLAGVLSGSFDNSTSSDTADPVPASTGTPGELVASTTTKEVKSPLSFSFSHHEDPDPASLSTEVARTEEETGQDIEASMSFAFTHDLRTPAIDVFPSPSSAAVEDPPLVSLSEVHDAPAVAEESSSAVFEDKTEETPSATLAREEQPKSIELTEEAPLETKPTDDTIREQLPTVVVEEAIATVGEHPSTETAVDHQSPVSSVSPQHTLSLPHRPPPLQNLPEDAMPSSPAPDSAYSLAALSAYSPDKALPSAQAASPAPSGGFSPSVDSDFDISSDHIAQAEHASPSESRRVFVPPSSAAPLPSASLANSSPATPDAPAASSASTASHTSLSPAANTSGASTPVPSPAAASTSPILPGDAAISLTPTSPLSTSPFVPQPRKSSFKAVVGRRTTIKHAEPRPQTVVYLETPAPPKVASHTVTDADLSFTSEDLGALLANAALLEERLAHGRTATPRKDAFAVPPVPHAAPAAPSAWHAHPEPRRELPTHVREVSHGRTDSNSTLRASKSTTSLGRKSGDSHRERTPPARARVPDEPVPPLPDFADFPQELTLSLRDASGSGPITDADADADEGGSVPPTPPPKEGNGGGSRMLAGLRSLKSAGTLRRVSMLLGDEGAARHSLSSSEDSASVGTPPAPAFDPHVLVTPPRRDDGASIVSRESHGSGWSLRKGKGLGRAATFADKIGWGSRRSRAASSSSSYTDDVPHAPRAPSPAPSLQPLAFGADELGQLPTPADSRHASWLSTTSSASSPGIDRLVHQFPAPPALAPLQTALPPPPPPEDAGMLLTPPDRSSSLGRSPVASGAASVRSKRKF